MKITTELNDSIVKYLESLGVLCGISIDAISINRTSMCNCDLCSGFDENESYHMIVEMIKEQFPDPKYRIGYSGKTDEDYFLDVYIK